MLNIYIYNYYIIIYNYGRIGSSIPYPNENGIPQKEALVHPHHPISRTWFNQVSRSTEASGKEGFRNFFTSSTICSKLFFTRAMRCACSAAAAAPSDTP